MKQYIFLLIISLLITGCDTKSKKDRQRDEFYTDKGGMHWGVHKSCRIKTSQAILFKSNL